MELTVKTSMGSYDITLERGAINKLAGRCDLSKKALIVTDSGVPVQYAETVAEQFKNSVIKVIPQGEKSKSFDTYKELLQVLNDESFSRADCVVAVGGGVVGDLSGFTAATYMRGITFYNIPTTLLSQVDSSIGGKTAIDFGGYKNTVGAFYQPKAVIIDPDVLSTLSDRQFNNGLAESIKMAATSDKVLFELIENEDAKKVIDTVIERSLKIKRAVVEEDEKETGLRRVLNFGHTAAHAIETATGLGDILHGESVAIGMLPFSSDGVKERLVKVLNKYNLKTTIDFSADLLLSAMRHDKKANATGVNAVLVDEIGTFRFEFIEFNELDKIIKEAFQNE
ncbi:MAG: 3-dehydroquinate synthase [Oscillospiraceae bacterium]|nr:3-dehydroquinate synthase [Oscillospiraceae bacterium]